MDAEKRIRAGLARLMDGSGVDAGLFDHDVLCGFVGLFNIDAGLQSGEMGYWIGKSAEGRGLMTRACQAMLRYGFEEPGLHRIELRCGARNSRSSALAERLGFRLEGRLRQADRVRDEWDDFLLYGLLADEWRGRFGTQ
jgi:ribosomal-protein-serine acetyltransferase